MALSRGAMGLSAVYDRGISLSYSFTIFFYSSYITVASYIFKQAKLLIRALCYGL